MIEWVVSFIPWWIWGIVGLIGLGAVRWFAGSWSNAWKMALGIVGVIGAIQIFKRGQHVGETKEQKKQKEAQDALEQHYDDIENSNPPNLDTDIGRLRALRDK